ncbi:MAG: hypothetical protein FIA94_13710 [Nitrospirae bacterium]|nr:hypothetical protein [Nitrospirota bacterium]
MVLAIWLIFLLVVSLIPLSSPKLPPHSDKVEHFIAYGITSILIFRYLAAKGRKDRISVFSVVIASSYGALIEVLQGLTPYRQFSFGDMAANAAGALVFCLAYAAYIKLRNPVT